MTNTKIGIIILAATAATLVACGGRGTVPTTPSAGFAPAAIEAAKTPAQPTAGHTNAYGYLYDDPSGKPLSGIAARLYLWSKPCIATSKTTRSCPAPIATTTTNAQGEFTFSNVPNAEYLLTLGDDLPTDLTRPTVHDRITLTGGVQRLVAPTLPNEPTPAPFHEPVPAIEKSGNYRLTTINQYETTCITEFDAERSKRNLPEYVVDEWMTENTRAIVMYRLTVTWRTKHIYPSYVPYGSIAFTYGIGGGNCQIAVVNSAFTTTNKGVRRVLRDPRGLWLASTYENGKEDGFGIAMYPIDPRAAGPTAPPPPWP